MPNGARTATTAEAAGPAARPCFSVRRNGCAALPRRRHRGNVAHRDLKVIDAAERAAQRLNDLIARHPRRLPHVSQLRRSVPSIGANIIVG